MRRIQLGNFAVTDSSEPYVIAEIGVNHEGSMERAKELIRFAKEGGANAAKFQTYKAESLASRNSPAYWNLEKEPTTSQYQLFKKYDKFGPEQYVELAEYCSKVGIDFLSTPFDEKAIEVLYPLVPFFKVASADLTNTPFLRKVASHEKPVVLSTGASTLGEIDQAVQTLQKAGCDEIALMHCILNYPTPNNDAHLGMITGLRRSYPEYVIGYSDHTMPEASMMPLVTAYLLGARVIEKHFTYDKSLAGNDHYHAMDVNDLNQFVTQIKFVRTLHGSEQVKGPILPENISRRNARRSIVLKQSSKAGTILTEPMLTYKRPGTGISPLHWDEVIGKRVVRNLEEDHILQWSDIDTAEKTEYKTTGLRLIDELEKEHVCSLSNIGNTEEVE